MAQGVLIDKFLPEDPKPGTIASTSQSSANGSGTFGLTQGSMIGYQPSRYRMTIETEKQDIVLVCDYDPVEFTELHGMEWSISPISGREAKPIAFQSINPREWSMKLFFNTLGDNKSSRSDVQERYVTDALDKLRRMSYPNVYGGLNVTTGVTYERPPTLNVFLTDRHFRCVITKMATTIKAIHPLGRYATRAEVDITFTEFVEFSY